MNKYTEKFTKKFLNDIKKLKNENLRKRFLKKRDEIINNPHGYKPLRNIFKGKQRIHIGSYVLIFEIQEDEKIILFHRFQHHDKAYKTKI